MKRKLLAPCPFCRLEPAMVFAESRHFRAVYNIAPILPGHSLVVPKRHVESVMDLSQAAAGEMMIFSREVASLLGRVFHTTGFNWTVQEKPEAGQTIAHLHLHVIPRKTKDLPQPGDWYTLLQQSQAEGIDSDQRPRLTPEQMRQITAHIKRFAA